MLAREKQNIEHKVNSSFVALDACQFRLDVGTFKSPFEARKALCPMNQFIDFIMDPRDPSDRRLDTSQHLSVPDLVRIL